MTSYAWPELQARLDTYLYDPAPQAAFADIARVRADALLAVNAGHKDEAVRDLERWDLLIRKLQVGDFIRTGRLDRQAVQAAEDLRERLEEMRDAVLAGDTSKAREMFAVVEAAYRQRRAAYRPGRRTISSVAS
jgi:hypothetical protein